MGRVWVRVGVRARVRVRVRVRVAGRLQHGDVDGLLDEERAQLHEGPQPAEEPHLG